jgi:hypothetical protein
MADFSDDDDVGVQNACEDIDKVQVVDESEQAEFFETLLHRYSHHSLAAVQASVSAQRPRRGINMRGPGFGVASARACHDAEARATLDMAAQQRRRPQSRVDQRQSLH